MTRGSSFCCWWWCWWASFTYYIAFACLVKFIHTNAKHAMSRYCFILSKITCHGHWFGTEKLLSDKLLLLLMLFLQYIFSFIQMLRYAWNSIRKCYNVVGCSAIFFASCLCVWDPFTEVTLNGHKNGEKYIRDTNTHTNTYSVKKEVKFVQL